MQLNTINQLPMKTWQWLNINDTTFNSQSNIDSFNKKVRITNAEGLAISQSHQSPKFPDMPAEIKSMRKYMEKNFNLALSITIPGGYQSSGPVVIEFNLDDVNKELIDILEIQAEEGSRATIVVCYRSSGNGPCYHQGLVTLNLQKDSHVKLIETQFLSDQDTHINTLYSQVDKGAQTELLLCELGSGFAAGSCTIDLLGEKSSAVLNGIYTGTGNRKLDFNYQIKFYGKETEGHITANGALAGQSQKTMKSTIDFRQGSSGAKGREEETVLTLSDKTINRSAPLLLCGEDNVEGEHATSTGKPDKQKLYYLMNRGMDEKSAKRLLVEATFTPLLNKIAPEALKKETTEWIQKVVHDED